MAATQRGRASVWLASGAAVVVALLVFPPWIVIPSALAAEVLYLIFVPTRRTPSL